MPVSAMILAAIAVLIAFLLLSRLKFYAYYDDKFDYKIKFLFFSFRIKQKKEGKAKKEEKNVQVQKKPEKFTLDKFRIFYNLFSRFWRELKKYIIKFKNKIRIDYIKVILDIGGSDPAQTAIEYGEACAVVFPAVSALGNLVKIKRREVRISPKFNGESDIEFAACISARVGSLLATGICAGVEILFSLIKNPINIEKTRQGGTVK